MPTARSHSNSFDAIRLLAAVAVVVGHGYVLTTGVERYTPQILGIGVHNLGVDAFFVISGYLVTQSWSRNPHAGVYFANRALRILPGLALVVVVTILALGPAFTTVSTADYFSSGETWRYAANLIPVLPQYDLPGVFAHLPYPDAVNGSLWTLRFEIACYVVVAASGLLPRSMRIPLMAAFGVVAAAIALTHITISGQDIASAGVPWVFFAVGSIVCVISERWRIVRIDVAAAVLVIWILVATLTPIDPFIPAWFAFSYVLLAVGQSSIPGVRSAARYGDLSYGLYLWAFPVQQAILQLGVKLPIAVDIILVTLVSGAFAMVSWHLIESPTLRLKKRIRTSADARRERREEPSPV